MSRPVPIGDTARQRHLVLAVLLASAVCLVWAAISLRLRPTHADDGLAFAVHAAQTANYSAESQSLRLAAVDPDIIQDIILHHEPNTTDLPSRLSTLAAVFQIPLSTATLIPAPNPGEPPARTPTPSGTIEESLPITSTLTQRPGATAPAVSGTPRFTPTRTVTPGAPRTLTPTATPTAVRLTLQPTLTSTPTPGAPNTLTPTATEGDPSRPTATPTAVPILTDTPEPTSTPKPAPTNTSVATKPATSTNPPVPSSTPSLTPTNTPQPTSTPLPTSTPAPTNTPNLCAVAAGPITTNDSSKWAKFDITNNSGSQIQIGSLLANWPESPNDKLKEVLFGSQQIYDLEDDMSPTNIPSEFPWKPGTDIYRLLDAGATKTLELRFDQGANNNGYDFLVTFTNGCSVQRTK